MLVFLLFGFKLCLAQKRAAIALFSQTPSPTLTPNIPTSAGGGEFWKGREINGSDFFHDQNHGLSMYRSAPSLFFAALLSSNTDSNSGGGGGDESEAFFSALINSNKTDREYAYTLKVDEKSDVYSFGVVLLELVSGRKPVGEFGDGVDIVQWVRQMTTGIKEEVVKILDPRLSTVPINEAMHVFYVAMLCVEEQAIERPTMREVVQMLTELPRPPTGRGGTNRTESVVDGDEPTRLPSESPGSYSEQLQDLLSS